MTTQNAVPPSSRAFYDLVELMLSWQYVCLLAMDGLTASQREKIVGKCQMIMSNKLKLDLTDGTVLRRQAAKILAELSDLRYHMSHTRYSADPNCRICSC